MTCLAPMMRPSDSSQDALVCSLLDEACTLLEVQALVSAPVRMPAPGPPPVGGASPPVTPTRTPRHWTAARICVALRAYAAREGAPPSREAWRVTRRHALPSRAAVCRLYGTLEAAYAASGLAYPASQRGKAAKPGRRCYAR